MTNIRYEYIGVNSHTYFSANQSSGFCLSFSFALLLIAAELCIGADCCSCSVLLVIVVAVPYLLLIVVGRSVGDNCGPWQWCWPRMGRRRVGVGEATIHQHSQQITQSPPNQTKPDPERTYQTKPVWIGEGHQKFQQITQFFHKSAGIAKPDQTKLNQTNLDQTRIVRGRAGGHS